MRTGPGVNQGCECTCAPGDMLSMPQDKVDLLGLFRVSDKVQ
jgi:hypothetical protein